MSGITASHHPIVENVLVGAAQSDLLLPLLRLCSCCCCCCSHRGLAGLQGTADHGSLGLGNSGGRARAAATPAKGKTLSYRGRYNSENRC